ncbi:hypothetical protein KDC22_09140 [Paenibacillus tritici]|nr:hypothetical protein [Paenibacillus tritici]QUL56626.1 hypothetical protein KDC22_09140 [Paenibacillus tritici]
MRYRAVQLQGPLGFNLDKKGHPDEQDVKNARAFTAGVSLQIINKSKVH